MIPNQGRIGVGVGGEGLGAFESGARRDARGKPMGKGQWVENGNEEKRGGVEGMVNWRYGWER